MLGFNFHIRNCFSDFERKVLLHKLRLFSEQKVSWPICGTGTAYNDFFWYFCCKIGGFGFKIFNHFILPSILFLFFLYYNLFIFASSNYTCIIFHLPFPCNPTPDNCEYNLATTYPHNFTSHNSCFLPDFCPTFPFWPLRRFPSARMPGTTTARGSAPCRPQTCRRTLAASTASAPRRPPSTGRRSVCLTAQSTFCCLGIWEVFLVPQRIEQQTNLRAPTSRSKGTRAKPWPRLGSTHPPLRSHLEH